MTLEERDQRLNEAVDKLGTVPTMVVESMVIGILSERVDGGADNLQPTHGHNLVSNSAHAHKIGSCSTHL